MKPVVVPHATASASAHRFTGAISHLCTQVAIAGSIRREEGQVSDIEVVCQPITEDPKTDPLETLIDELIADGTLTPWLDKNGRKSMGPKSKRLVFEGTRLDMFIVRPPAQWGVIMAIRTGPAEYSKLLVTQLSKYGLLFDGYRVSEGSLWKSDTQAVDTPTEADFLRYCGQETPVPPSQRQAHYEDICNQRGWTPKR